MPVLERMTPAEKRIVTRTRTPYAAQRWLRSLRYNWERTGPTMRSLRGVVRTRSAHCLEGALAAATVLESHGYPPLLLDLESQDGLDHVVFAFRTAGKWGAVGMSRDVGLWGRRPRFASVRALARSYRDPFVDLTGRITAFALLDLRQLDPYDWRLSERNRWKVERRLLETPHVPLPSDDRRYIRMRKRYRRFIETHATHDTPFRRGARHWM